MTMHIVPNGVLTQEVQQLLRWWLLLLMRKPPQLAKKLPGRSSSRGKTTRSTLARTQVGGRWPDALRVRIHIVFVSCFFHVRRVRVKLESIELVIFLFCILDTESGQVSVAVGHIY